MGAGQSVPEGGKTPTRGLHVLRVTPSSPASQTDLEPFFDFIVGYEDASLSLQNANIEAHDFEKVVEEHEGRRLDLIVWSSKSQSIRNVPIIPSREWSQPGQGEDSGSNQVTSQPSLLGLSMRVCEPEFSLDNVWHVLDVLEGSPAESAGLVPYGDWIVGWSGGVLAAEGDFYDVVEAHEDKPLRVYVYSYDFDTLREVVLVPNRQWGGEGLLGCVFGYGLLHRIPLVQESSEEQENQFFDGSEVFVPADHEEYENHDYGREDGDYEAETHIHERQALPPAPSSMKGRPPAPSASAAANGVDNRSNPQHYLDPPLRPSDSQAPAF